ncbi:MAG: hypothetical protein HDR44_04245 [Allobaculum sp.]|nr:hypothetical protein [Allobaculum sp.]
MKKGQSYYSQDSDWFYKLYARENQLDYLQLCILDLLREAGGAMTWMAILNTLSYPAVSLRDTARELEWDGLVEPTPDGLTLTEFAEFSVYEILDDLHCKMEETLFTEDVTPNLAA